MSIFDFLMGGRDRAADPSTRDASDNRWFDGAGGARSEIDVKVTIPRARQVPVVSDCLRVLAENIAGLENGVFRRIDETKVERIADHPIARIMENPNHRHTGFEFVFSIVDDLSTAGDFYAEKIYDRAGNLNELWRIDDPVNVIVEETLDRHKRFRFRDRFGRERVLLDHEVWHIPRPPLVADIKGTSPILEEGREAVAVAIALQRYANILFTNDATPPYVFSMPSHFSDKASKDNFMAAWRRWSTGRNRHTPGVLEYGMTPHRMGLTAEESQFLETRRELWLDLTRLWRVPPHKVGILDKATFSNIEHQSLEFVTDTLRPVLELIERSAAKHLINEANVYFEFNVESLLRGDIKARYEAYALGRQWGWLSVNDILRAERKNGIGAAGDRYIEPLNMVPVGTGGQDRQRTTRAGIDTSIAFLRHSVAATGGRPRLELVKDAA